MPYSAFARKTELSIATSIACESQVGVLFAHTESNRIWFWRIADDWNAIQLLHLATTQCGIYGFDSALYSWCTSNTCIRTLHIEFIRIACIWSAFFSELFDEKRCEKNTKMVTWAGCGLWIVPFCPTREKKVHFHQIWKKIRNIFKLKSKISPMTLISAVEKDKTNNGCAPLIQFLFCNVEIQINDVI